MDGFEFFGLFGIMFTVIPICFLIVFIIILVTFISRAVKGARESSNNNKQPVLAIPVKLIAKRTQVSSKNHMNSDSFDHHHTSTTYYLTFEAETGSRMEFTVNGNVYGLFIEGDTGKLEFQGTRFISFERQT